MSDDVDCTCEQDDNTFHGSTHDQTCPCYTSNDVDERLAQYGGGKVDPKLTAGFDMLRRTGARSVELRYQDDKEPTVWFAIGEWLVHGHTTTTFEVDASTDPVRAVMRLCSRVIDGGQCQHCRRTSGFTSTSKPKTNQPNICWQRWHAATESFRRDCDRT